MAVTTVTALVFSATSTAAVAAPPLEVITGAVLASNRTANASVAPPKVVSSPPARAMPEVDAVVPPSTTLLPLKANA